MCIDVQLHVSYWPGGQPFREWSTDPASGRRHGTFREWSESGYLSKLLEYTLGKRGNEWRWWSASQLACRITFDREERHVEDRFWHPNGQLSYVATAADRRVLAYYSNGELQTDEHWDERRRTVWKQTWNRQGIEGPPDELYSDPDNGSDESDDGE
jgi:antitoxin component YwqK of YwqJK toxin-antitoxin module